MIHGVEIQMILLMICEKIAILQLSFYRKFVIESIKLYYIHNIFYRKITIIFCNPFNQNYT